MDSSEVPQLSPYSSRVIFYRVAEYIMRDVEHMLGHAGALFLFTSPRLPAFNRNRIEERLLIERRNALPPPIIQLIKAHWVFERFMEGWCLKKDHLISTGERFYFYPSSPIYNSPIHQQLRHVPINGSSL